MTKRPKIGPLRRRERTRAALRHTILGPPSVSKNGDFLLIHGNGPNDPDLIRRCIAGTRALAGSRKPVLINEDPNFHFTEESNHLLASVGEHVSWGYYDQGQNNYQDGYQSVPVNWGINTDNKKQFFELVKKVTGV